MTSRENQNQESAIGSEINTGKLGPHAVFRTYLVDRPAHTKRLLSVEAAVDISITLAQPVRTVWPIFKNFNSWMNRFGYVWDSLPAENEDGFAYLRNTGASNDLKYGSDGSRMRYVVRKVIPEHLIYIDSLPLRLVDKDGVWSGHNVMTLREENGQTKICVFMEHTWFSEVMTIEELRAEAGGLVSHGVGFWRDYFIPDLVSLVETGKIAVAG